MCIGTVRNTNVTQFEASSLDTMIGPGGVDPAAATAHFTRGLELEAAGDRLGALGEYESAVATGGMPEHMFRLAYILDLVGEESRAMQLYEEISTHRPPHINALINLAVLHEDRGEIVKAERCLRQVLDTNPNHERARLYMADVLASRDMYYDEEAARDTAKRNALLDTPVTDFELSVRARNCLKKMQIRTLGDLLKISEAELLSYRNFGETTLHEIKAMLSCKGLRLGQTLDAQYNRVRQDIYDELRGQAPEAILNRPITQLDLSVRARKALQMLGVQTVGDLATRTEAELMGVKNFGATSLDEVNEKLGDLNLSLRHLDE
jgi:DNA-directed RNA polymerase subunit alpha